MPDRARTDRGAVPPWIERTPKWQHFVYTVLSVLALGAAIFNAITASTTTRQLVHAGIAVLMSGIAISLVTWYARRDRP